ncbi:hypothetical protein M1N92_04495 [Dehalococcoidia bacterium]|nr:hypothetical protein [Dehalococcoidia bacterium]
MKKTDQAALYQRAEGFIYRMMEEAPVAATQLETIASTIVWRITARPVWSGC